MHLQIEFDKQRKTGKEKLKDYAALGVMVGTVIYFSWHLVKAWWR